MAPVMLGIAVFLIGPLFYAFYLSLTDWDGFVKANFVGFRNFGRLFLDRELYVELFNTLKYMIGVVPCTIIIALGIASLLNSKVRGRAFFRTAFFLPMVTMPTAIAAVWRWLYNSQYGLVNYLTRPFGWNPMWLGDPRYILIAVIIVAIWSGIGYASIILLAGLQNIPKTLYEAAEIDGAGALRQFTQITVPLLSPSIFFLTITSMIGAFKAFDLIFMFSGGGISSGPTSQAVRTMVYGIYHKGFVLMQMGYAAAEAVVLFAIILLVTLLQFYLQKKLVFYD